MFLPPVSSDQHVHGVHGRVAGGLDVRYVQLCRWQYENVECMDLRLLHHVDLLPGLAGQGESVRQISCQSVSQSVYHSISKTVSQLTMR